MTFHEALRLRSVAAMPPALLGDVDMTSTHQQARAGGRT